MIKELFIKNKFLYYPTLMLLLISIVGSIMIVLRKYIIGDAWYSFLIWNLFLAWIPYIISIVIYHLYELKNIFIRKILVITLLIFWLLFYPNAPYMITDYIHLENYDNVLMWYDFVVFSLFIYSSFIMGFISIYIVFCVVSKKFNIIISWLIIIYILFISSYGIYLGRVFRLNSWDIIFRPFLLLKNIVINFNKDAVIFSFSFAILLAMIYTCLYFITFIGRKINKNVKN